MQLMYFLSIVLNIYTSPVTGHEPEPQFKHENPVTYEQYYF